MTAYRDVHGPTCDACHQPVLDGQLSMNAEGQRLCRTCFGSYQSAKADQRARANDVFRRCRCGAVLSPFGDTTIQPSHNVEANVGYIFQPSLYSCSRCGRRFRVAHPVMIAIHAVFVAFMVAVAGTVGGIWSLLVLVLLSGPFVFAISKRVRYPRVR